MKTLKRHLDVKGLVQGVGFRPFAWRLAQGMGLAGQVGNTAQGAWVDIEGQAESLDLFVERLKKEIPAPGRIDHVKFMDGPASGTQGFSIEASQFGGDASADVLPDLATCPDCLRELTDPADRRFGYPFINCTHCGPRYSILRKLPYDRPNTTMRDFALCPDCEREYRDPRDRRFHAQPLACPVCGPRLWFHQHGQEQVGDAIDLACRALMAGSIVAIKGLGGFHLACRADDAAAVERLRERKGREAKPFAVMVPSLEMARQLGRLDAAAEASLSSPVRPILLVPKASVALAEAVAPGSGYWGLMLPYTPLHHLLLQGLNLPLVMTSGNPSGEPLCSDNGEALERLVGLADAFLLHDRDIARPVDDSVVALLPGPTPLRRARGLAPGALELGLPAKQTVLGLGGDMKSAVCLVQGSRAVLSEHLGELDLVPAWRHFLGAIERLEQLLQSRPQRLAADLHPLYAATRWAKAQDLPLTLVQHHHAHIVSAMAEQGLHGRVIGIALDGTGYGTDGGLWGCEILACDRAEFRRAAHLKPFSLVGGDAASLDTWRPALGLLQAAFPQNWQVRAEALRAMALEPNFNMALHRQEKLQGALACTSAGRLFDAAAALLGLCSRNRFEAEAPQALQALAESVATAEALPMDLRLPLDPEAPFVLDPVPLLKALLKGGDKARLARGFHEGLAQGLTLACMAVARREDLDRVVLSGGCFANALLTALLTRRLRAAGFKVYTHQHVPCNDGGLALGQAVIAAQFAA